MNDWNYIWHHPNEFGITVFVSAVLFALALYHFILYFQIKEKVYWLYALYTFLVFVYTYYRDGSFFLTDMTRAWVPHIEHLSDIIKWIYTSVYFYFAMCFIELKKHFSKWHKFYTRTINISFAAVFLLGLYTVLSGNNKLAEYAYNFFYLPVIFILGIHLLYLISKTPGKVKYYLMIGSGVYLIVTTYSHILTYTGNPFRVLFYSAIVFESMFFALGLGAKNKNLMEEKHRMQAKILDEHEKYLALQERIHHQLDREIAEKTDAIRKLEMAKAEADKNKWEIELHRRTLDLRMRALQTQMNPHFLFNSLNAIKHLIIANEQEKAVYFLGKLSRLIRLILDNSRKKSISLAQELDILRLYVEVENIRLHQNISLTIDVENDLDTDNIELPPLLLHPLLENAIWHGLAHVKYEKKIHVSAGTREDMLIVEISDNGIGRDKAAEINLSKMRPKEASGLNLTLERLKNYAGDKAEKARLYFEDIFQNGKSAGTKVVLEIPLDKL